MAVVFKGPLDEFGEAVKSAVDQALSGRTLKRPKILGRRKSSRRREITRELLETIKERELCLSQLDEGLVAFGENLTVLFNNPAAKTLLGMEDVEFVGRNLLDLLQEPAGSASEYTG